MYTHTNSLIHSPPYFPQPTINKKRRVPHTYIIEQSVFSVKTNLFLFCKVQIHHPFEFLSIRSAIKRDCSQLQLGRASMTLLLGCSRSAGPDERVISSTASYYYPRLINTRSHSKRKKKVCNSKLQSLVAVKYFLKTGGIRKYIGHLRVNTKQTLQTIEVQQKRYADESNNKITV